MNVVDLFSGIGGFSLGLERAGFKTVAFCEINEYCRKVLKTHWPDVPIYEDVKEVNAKRLAADGITDIGIITGGFPCQDISVAGKQKGITGERSGLWTELCRIISDVRPQYAIMENVSALISGGRGRWFGRVLGDLAEIGYDAEWHCIPASAIGAPHQRDRIWIIAHPMCTGGWLQQEQPSECEKATNIANDGTQKSMADAHNDGSLASEVGKSADERSNSITQGSIQAREFKRLCTTEYQENVADTEYTGLQRQREEYRLFKDRSKIEASWCSWWSTEPDVGRVAYGVSEVLDRDGNISIIPTPKNQKNQRAERLKGLGNAVVPQIPELIGRTVMEANKE